MPRGQAALAAARTSTAPPERVGTLRTEFRAGVLAWDLVSDAVAFGRANGLRVEVHYSGWLIRHGWIVAYGKESALRALQRYTAGLFDAG